MWSLGLFFFMPMMRQDIMVEAHGGTKNCSPHGGQEAEKDRKWAVTRSFS
jgi:hypothetical protein